MKKRDFWFSLRTGIKNFGKKSGRVVKTTGEMAGELERMGRLGGQLFVMRVN